jgi:MerR HTH family regulatory protein
MPSTYGEALYPGGRDKTRDYSSGEQVVTDLSKMNLGASQSVNLDGVMTECFTIGQLAAALNRKSVTLRKWEAEGIIPPATYRTQARTVNGRYRLYSRAQVEVAVLIAYEEKLLVQTWKPIKDTKFTSRIFAAWQELDS